MTGQGNQYSHANDYADDAAYYGGAGAEPERGAPLARVILLLRGRIHWAVILAVVLGGAAAVAVFYSTPPKYLVGSQFFIHPKVMSAIHNSPNTQIPPMFREYLDAQRALLVGRKVRVQAMESDRWQAAVTEVGEVDDAWDDFQVSRAKGSYVFYVSNAHEIPVVAEASVNAVVEAFKSEFDKRESDVESVQMTRLVDLKVSLDRKLSQLQERQAAVTDEITPAELKIQYESKMRERSRIQQMLSETQFQLNMLTLHGKEGEKELSIAQIKIRDPKMQALITRLEENEEEIAHYEALGMGENHPSMRRSRDLNESLKRQINRRAEEFGSGLARETGGDAMDIQVQEIDMLRAQVEQLKSTLDVLQAETASMGLLVSRVVAIERDIESTIEDREVVEERIDMLVRNSSSDSGRMEIVNLASRPTSPTNFKARVQAALVAGLFGGFVGVGIVLLIGLLDRQVRHVADAQFGMPDLRMLGVLPTLPDTLEDPEQAEFVANSVHHIRTVLQLGHEEESRAISITSASAGSGKSSLTVALGMSYASSGSKTLLIDGDVVGGGLTRRLMGAEKSEIGLLEACSEQQPLANCTVTPPGSQLDLLPLGHAKSSDAGSLSAKMWARLIVQARQTYDIVIVDTGPALGSLEASMVAPEVDGVLMVVSRGDQKNIVTHSVEHIRSLGANVAGVVFNHALEQDIDHTSYGSYISYARSMESGERPALKSDTNASARFGPLGSAVAAFRAPPDPQGKGEHHSGAA